VVRPIPRNLYTASGTTLLRGGSEIARRDRARRSDSGGTFYGWRRGWPIPELSGRYVAALSTDDCPPVSLLAELADLPESEILRRLNVGNKAYLLRVDDEPASYGWSATGPADIGNLKLSFTVPQGERYLWDFVTLPAFRGRGLYPHLLQHILRSEMAEAEWFWIGHESDNEASRRGIHKAGFRPAGHIRRRPSGLELVAAPTATRELAGGAAHALGLNLATDSQLRPGSAPAPRRAHEC